MSLRLSYEISGSYPKMLKATQGRIAKTATKTMHDAADLMKSQGRSAMASGGMSTRFQNTLRSNVYPSSGVSLTPAALLYDKIPWAGIFETGGTIAGSPMLWLPIDENLPLQARGKRWTPKDFTNQIGPLRSGKHGSKPLLFGQVRVGKSGGVLALPSKRGNQHFSKQKKQWRPVFVGVSSVTEKKRFDITAVVEKVSDQLGEIYSKNWEASNG
jgi:hypothetical protein